MGGPWLGAPVRVVEGSRDLQAPVKRPRETQAPPSLGFGSCRFGDRAGMYGGLQGYKRRHAGLQGYLGVV